VVIIVTDDAFLQEQLRREEEHRSIGTPFACLEQRRQHFLVVIGDPVERRHITGTPSEVVGVVGEECHRDPMPPEAAHNLKGIYAAAQNKSWRSEVRVAGGLENHKGVLRESAIPRQSSVDQDLGGVCEMDGRLALRETAYGLSTTGITNKSSDTRPCLPLFCPVQQVVEWRANTEIV
jgi:hypothetical protein